MPALEPDSILLPRPGNREVKRDAFVAEIRSLFDKGTSIVDVSGDPGAGKTTLLAQFTRELGERCIAVFVQPCPFVQDDSVIRNDLVSQIRALLGLEIVDALDQYTETSLRNLVARLGRTTAKSHLEYYFIIDGLKYIKERDPGLFEQVISYLPLGVRGFRFLTTDLSVLEPFLSSSVTRDRMRLPGLSADEARYFLEDADLSDEDRNTLIKMSRGSPQYLAMAKHRLSASKITLKNLPDQFGALLEYEWTQVESDPSLCQMLALAIFGPPPPRVDVISRLSEKPEATVRGALMATPFITVDESGILTAASQSVEVLLRTKLAGHESASLETIVSDLLLRPDDDEAVEYLPDYLTSLGRLQEVLQRMSPDRLLVVLNKVGSASQLGRHVGVAVDAALKLDNYGELVRLSAAGSIIRGAGLVSWATTEEIRARWSLGYRTHAEQLARSDPVAEVRLRLLALVGRLYVEDTDTCPIGLSDEIRELRRRVDTTMFDRTALIDLASDVASFAPDLAVNLLQHEGKEPIDEDTAHLVASVLTAKGRGVRSDWMLDGDDLASGDDGLTQVVFSGYSLERLIREAENITDLDLRLEAIQLWLAANRRSDGDLEATDVGLTAMIRNTTSTPNGRTLRRLCVALPYASRDAVERLLPRFEAQLAILSDVGPRVEILRTLTLLARAASSVDQQTAHNLRTRAVEMMSEIEDPVTRAECSARLYVDGLRAGDMDSDKHLDTQLAIDIIEVLDNSGLQLYALRSVIGILAAGQADKALELVPLLNTKNRREEALVTISKTLCSGNLGANAPQRIQTMLDAVGSVRARNAIIRSVVDGSQRHDQDILAIFSPQELVSLACRLSDADLKCQALCDLHAVFVKHSVSDQECQKTIERAKDAYEAISDSLVKTVMAYRIAAAVGHTDRLAGAAEIAAADSARAAAGIEAAPQAHSFILAVNVAIRAYGALLQSSAANETDADSTWALINRVDSDIQRGLLLARLATEYHKAGQNRDAERIVSDHLKPILDKLMIDNRIDFELLLGQCAPVWYKCFPNAVLGMLGDTDQQDEIKTAIIRYNWFGVFPGDPIPKNYERAHVDCMLLEEALTLAAGMKADGTIFQIARVAAQIGHDSRRFTGNQRVQLATSVRLLASKMPMPNCIQHIGYQIGLEGCALQLERAKDASWLALAERVPMIGNKSDEAFVYGLLARAAHSVAGQASVELFARATQTVVTIPIIRERWERAEDLVGLAKNCGQPVFGKVLRDVWTGLKGSVSDSQESYKSLVDTVYQTSPELAEWVIEQTDNDEARVRARRVLERASEAHDLRSAFESSDSADARLNRCKDHEIAGLAFHKLALLQGNGSETLTTGQITSLMSKASSMAFEDAFWVYACVIESAARRWGPTREANRYIRPLFRAALAGAALAAHLCGAPLASRVASEPSEEAAPEQITVIKPGQRPKALAAIKRWFEDQAEEYIKIADSWWTPTDLELLRMIQLSNPALRIRILTSVRAQNQGHVPRPYREAYLNAWKSQYREVEPPDADIVIVGLGNSGRSPVHDRWIVSHRGALVVGTSFNGLGRDREATIVVCSNAEAKRLEAQVDPYLNSEARYVNGEKLSYESFNLWT